MKMYCGEQDYPKRWLYSAEGNLVHFMEKGILTLRPIGRDEDNQKEITARGKIGKWDDTPMFQYEGRPVLIVDCLGD